MDADWLTYREAAKRLGSNIEAVRQRAIRCRWPRTIGNDKRARIQIPEGVTNPSQEGNDRGSQEGTDRGSRKGNDRAYDRPNEGTFIKAPGNKRPPLGFLRASAFARLTTSGRPARRHRSLRRYELVDTFYDAAVSGADPASERSGFGQMLERFARDLMQLAGHDI